MSAPIFENLSKGQEIGSRTVSVDRATLIRYAGASGDRNPIHWNERFAVEVGLPGVIAHGMWTMGSVVNLVSDWVQDPGKIRSYTVRFTRPIPVPDPGTVEVDVVAKIGALDPEARTARIDLTATFDGARVLGKAQVVVAL